MIQSKELQFSNTDLLRTVKELGELKDTEGTPVPLKADAPMDVTVVGIDSAFLTAESSNAESPMVTSPPKLDIVNKLLHWKNADVDTIETELPKSAEANDAQLLKADAPMLTYKESVCDAIVNEDTLVPQNALSSIDDSDEPKDKAPDTPVFSNADIPIVVSFETSPMDSRLMEP